MYTSLSRLSARPQTKRLDTKNYDKRFPRLPVTSVPRSCEKEWVDAPLATLPRHRCSHTHHLHRQLRRHRHKLRSLSRHRRPCRPASSTNLSSAGAPPQASFAASNNPTIAFPSTVSPPPQLFLITFFNSISRHPSPRCLLLTSSSNTPHEFNPSCFKLFFVLFSGHPIVLRLTSRAPCLSHSLARESCPSPHESCPFDRDTIAIVPGACTPCSRISWACLACACPCLCMLFLSCLVPHIYLLY